MANYRTDNRQGSGLCFLQAKLEISQSSAEFLGI